MSKIFISYSHDDKQQVRNIVKKIKDAGHEIWIDESRLSISDTISTEIQKNIQNSDYVIVFLSSKSVGSEWVRQEIYETLYQELKNRELKLIPCLLDDCEFPKAFTKSKKFERIYEKFIENEKEATENILSILNASPRAVFEDEYYAILNIPVPGLEIYLAGDTYGWDSNNEMKYFETVDSYLLFGFSIEPFKYFKHFVLCEERDAEEIRGKLKSLGDFIVGDTGDVDGETNKRRIWFKVKFDVNFSNHPFKITGNNNQWLESAQNNQRTII